MNTGSVCTAIAELQSGRPANIAYPEKLRHGVLRAVESWKAFCELSTERKQNFVYMDDQVRDGSGYELKDKKGSKLDLKENFHVTLWDVDRLMNDAFEGGAEGKRELAFIHEANELIKSTVAGVGEFMGYLGKALCHPDLKQEVMDNRDHWVFRYLHYFGGCAPGDEIAAPHADKSGITLHLFESTPGLQYLDFDMQWRPMPVHDGEMAIIPGMRLQLVSENKLKALCHRVVANEEACRFGRYSIVCFIPLGTKVVNKNVVGRIQDFSAGFNYEMHLAELQGLFI